MIHTVKGFSVVSEAEVNVFMEFSCFICDWTNVGNLISDSSAFSKPSLYIKKFSVHILLKPNLKDFEHNLAGLQNECSCMILWIFFDTAVLWDWNGNTDLFQSCGHCWVFQTFWHTACSTFTTSSFRIWNSSVGIPLPPLSLFAVMLPKAHLTSHSRMSGSRWVTTPSWLFRSLRPFLYSSSVYSFHLLISSAFVKFLLFLSFIVPILAWNVPLISLIFLTLSLAFPFYFFSTSLHCSLRKAFLSLLDILWNAAFSWIHLSLSPLLFLFFPQLFVKPPQTTTLPSCISSFRGDDFGHCLLYSVTNPCP